MAKRVIENWESIKTAWSCYNTECDEEVKDAVVSVDFFQENGTPICNCGDDMLMDEVYMEDEL